MAKMPMTSLLIIIAFTVLSCAKQDKKSASDKSENESEEIVVVEEEVTIVEDVWVISEEQINDVPVTKKAHQKKQKAKKESEKEKQEEEAEIEEAIVEVEEDEMEEAYIQEVVEAEIFEAELAEQEYEAQREIEVTEAIVMLDETETISSYNKKGKEISEFQIIHSGDGEITQIIFDHKKHHDVYDVQAGMSGKEVKKLRKKMKHFVKKGQVFLYDDTSNIMYLMDAKDGLGDEVTEADIETMEVQAIIWKDKKHHKKNK